MKLAFICLDQVVMSWQSNQTLLNEKFVRLRYVYIPNDDFIKQFHYWEEFFEGLIYKLIIGPISFLTIIWLIPAFAGIFQFISQRHIK